MKRFNLYFVLVSLVVDAVAIFSGLLVAYNLRSDGTELYLWSYNQYLSFIWKFLPIWLILLASQGLYNPRILAKGWSAIGKLLVGLLSGWGVMLIVLYLWRSPAALTFPRLVITYGIAWTFVFTVFGRGFLTMLLGIFHRLGVGMIRTAVVASKNAEQFINHLHDTKHGRLVAGVVRENYLAELATLQRQKPLDEVIVADSTLPEVTLLSILDWAESHGANFVLVPSLMSVRATNVEVSALAGTPVTYFLRTPLEGWGKIYKRLLDLIFVIPALVILSPLLLLLLILVPLTSRGPAIYREPRVGQDGRPLFVHKFRSMYSNWRQRFPEMQDWSADERTDPRITPLGHFIRQTNLDELPQLFDVLVGKMSLVGPRPEQPHYVEKFAQEVAHYLKRHHVKSGLTGWAQINGLRGNTSIKERVKYDLYYIENWSIWFDLRIILSTFLVLFRQAIGRS